MSLLEVAPVLAILVVGATILALPALRVGGLVTLLLLARTFSDLGSTSSTGPVLPATLLNAVIAILLVGLALVPGRRLPDAVRRLLLAVLVLVAFGTGIGVLRFGLSGGSLQEALRLVSVVAVFVLGARLPVDETKAGRRLALLTGVPALVLVTGALLGLAPTTQLNGRAAGAFSHANAAAAYFAIACLSCLGWWLRRHRASLGLSGLIALVGLGLTQSLGGLAGFAAAALLVVIASSRLSPRRVLPLVSLLVVVWVVVSTTGVGVRLTRLLAGSSSSENGDSLAWRFLNWRLLLERWHEHPWVGFGLGSTRNHVTPLDAPPHSLPVQVLLETGVVGALAAGCLVLVVVCRLLGRLRARRSESVLVLSLLLLAGVNGAESNLLNYTPALYLVALTAGLLVPALSRGSSPGELVDALALEGTFPSERPHRPGAPGSRSRPAISGAAR